MNKTQFVAYIAPQLNEYGVELCLEPTTNLTDDNLGCFDYSAKKLCVANLHRDSFQILLHEFCHFLQWSQRPVFFDKMATSTHNYLTWLESNKPINSKVFADKKKSLTLEWDCENRALKLIDSLDLRISRESYARKANSYLLTYHMATSYHKWPTNLNFKPSVQSLLPQTLLPLDKILDPDWLDDKLLARMRKAFN